MEYVIEVRAVVPQLFAAARQRTTAARVSAEIQRLLEGPWGFIKNHPDVRTDGHNVAVYWDKDSVEVGVQVVKRFDPTETVVCSETPAGQAATTAHFGSYRDLGAAHQAVTAWCSKQGLSLAGPSWEIYGDWDEDPAKVRTDVFWLLR